jgi:NAD(P)-dependent dehydrogenase (short-subunit alcohol dehydrogenase family)
MVANAGIAITKPFLESKTLLFRSSATHCEQYFLLRTLGTLEDWDKSFDINGKGVFLCYKYAAQHMIQQGRGGRIIGACSLGGKQGEYCWR